MSRKCGCRCTQPYRTYTALQHHTADDAVATNAVEMRISASEERLDDVRMAYPEDSILGPVVGHLRGGSAVPDAEKHRRVKERAKAYRLEDGLLYHKPSGGKLCIPASLRTDVIREAHVR